MDADRSVLEERRPVRIGDRAPDFALPDGAGGVVRLSELVARGPVVVFFYPGDFSPACTVEACVFRDRLGEFAEHGASIVGISGDGAGRHGLFARTFSVPFPLLSDEDGSVRAAYGVRRTLGIMAGRVTVVVDRGGVVRMVYRSQLRPREHVRRALVAVRSLALRGTERSIR